MGHGTHRQMPVVLIEATSHAAAGLVTPRDWRPLTVFPHRASRHLQPASGAGYSPPAPAGAKRRGQPYDQRRVMEPLGAMEPVDTELIAQIEAASPTLPKVPAPLG